MKRFRQWWKRRSEIVYTEPIGAAPIVADARDEKVHPTNDVAEVKSSTEIHPPCGDKHCKHRANIAKNVDRMEEAAKQAVLLLREKDWKVLRFQVEDRFDRMPDHGECVYIGRTMYGLQYSFQFGMRCPDIVYEVRLPEMKQLMDSGRLNIPWDLAFTDRMRLAAEIDAIRSHYEEKAAWAHGVEEYCEKNLILLPELVRVVLQIALCDDVMRTSNDS